MEDVFLLEKGETVDNIKLVPIETSDLVVGVQRWFHCSPDSFIAATSSCCFFLNQKIPQRATVTVPIWGFPKIGVPQNGWFIMENPMKMDF